MRVRQEQSGGRSLLAGDGLVRSTSEHRLRAGSYLSEPGRYSFFGAVNSLTDVVRQLNAIVAARNTNVAATAHSAARVGPISIFTVRNTNTTEPASAVST